MSSHKTSGLPFAALSGICTLCLALVCPPFRALGNEMHIAKPKVYSGMADASGAVAISSNLFIVASDEDSILRLYRNDSAGAPINAFDFSDFLDLRGKSLETDLEAGTRMGNRAFWISSHGTNKDAKGRPNRRCFFATDIKVSGGQVLLSPVGQPCERMLDDMIADSKFDKFHLAEAAKRAPKTPGALAIEGLSPTPEGHLLIGFRNPIPDEKALIIPLLNPNEVIAGKRARFGEAIQLDLDDLGVRDLAYHEGAYIISAGSFHGGGKFQLYRWGGVGTEPKRIKVKRLGDYTPEAIIIYPDRGLGEIQILSDDGARIVDGVPRKEFHSPGRLTFRSFWVVHRDNLFTGGER